MPVQDRFTAATGPVRTIANCALLSISASLTGCSEGILAIHGPIAGAEIQLLNEATVAMLLVVVPVIGIALFVAWWFRASNSRATYRPQWSYSGKIEFTVWMIPLLIVFFLGTLAWVGAHDLDPYKKYGATAQNRRALTIEVVSLDWKWLFIYPDLGIASINELVLPANRPIDLRLTSATVMNSFFVPGWAGQIYTMPGMQTQLSFLVADAVESQGFSAHFSGDGFSDMHFKAIATRDDSFDTWVSMVKASGGTLGRDAYSALALRHQAEPVSHFAAVDADLFDYALSQAAAPPANAAAPTEGT